MSAKVVYIHKKKTNGEVFYVGMGNKYRPYQKCNGSRSDFWYSTVRIYGYTVEIIKEGLTKQEAFDLEIKLIKKYGRRDKGLGTLVNLTDGGDAGGGGYGYGFLIRKSVYNIETGQVYESITDACKHINISASSVTSRLNGRRKFDKSIPIREMSNPYPEDAMEEGTVYLNELDNIELIEGYSYRPYYPNDSEYDILNKFEKLDEMSQNLIIESYNKSLREIQKEYPMIHYSYAHRTINKSLREVLGDDFDNKHNNKRNKRNDRS